MSAPRGQNLVLLSLTMLFLALMVTMTIGLGLRIRQKHELQNLADAAAYSNAVMTARTFNNMAAINRLEVSYWVAQSADQSLISWTGYARAMANGAHNAASEIVDGPCRLLLPPRTRTQLRDFRTDVKNYVHAEIDVAEWKTKDQAAGEESLGIQMAIVGLRSQLSKGVVSPNPGNLRDEFYRQIATQQLTQQIVALSRQDDISVIDTGTVANPRGAGKVSMREVDCDFGDRDDGPLTGAEPRGSGLCLRATWSENVLQAAMGSRGHSFLTGRPQLPGTVAQRLNQLANKYSAVSLSLGGKAGSGYWADRLTDGNSPTGTEAWGDDHGSVTVSAGACRKTLNVTAHVRSTHEINKDDQHMWAPAVLSKEGGGDEDEVQPELHHTMGDCSPLCPSVWVRTIGFEPSKDDAADAWGQPKAMVALQRDLTLKTFPWELHFSFPFSATGPPSEWDGRGAQLHTRVGKGLNITRQTAVATGIAYYHRRDHWDEFPNLLNPFWRATLAPIDIDDSPQHLNEALTAPEHRWQRDAFQALQSAGYQGLH